MNTNDNGSSTARKTWFITGAGRGMGVDFAKAALEAGHGVVATGRNPDRVREAVGEHEDLLTVALDVTSAQDAEDAVQADVDRFGGIDVLVNNAGNFFGGFFGELSPQQVRSQIETNLFGPMNTTRAVLPGHARAALRAGALDLVAGRVPGRRAEGPAPARADRRLPRAVNQPRPR